MSIKKLFCGKKHNKNTEQLGEVSLSKASTDEEMAELRELAREMSWTYSMLPPTGFTGCFWHFF